MSKVRLNGFQMNKPIWLRLILIYSLLNGFSLLTDSSKSFAVCVTMDPFPAKISDINNWENSRFGQATFKARDNNQLNIYYYIPSQFSANSPIVFVMHGSGRNALDYLETFAPMAERYNAIALAPEFPTRYYPQSQDYNLGVGISSVPDSGDYDATEWKDAEDYNYSEIEHLFETVKQFLGTTACGYYLVGHSAGGQFIHRMLTFLPEARVIRAVAANSGWYTLPSNGGGNNLNYYMPYGLQGTPLNDVNIATSFSQKLTILVGEYDTNSPSEDSSVRGTTEAMFQGNNRNERAQFYYQTAEQQAQSLNTALNWKFGEVPKAGHSFAQMLQSAAWYMVKGQDEIVCSPSTAAQASHLVINEINADPAAGDAGDANKDGERDASDDEFIELLNAGQQSICLSGWTLGDSSNRQRHVFPLGTQLNPGQALVVFGGGIPIGNFGDAIVQWAAYSGSLSLTNAGDAIRLYDNNGDLTQTITWGNCGNVSCAADHIPYSLDINQSLVRWPESSGAWVPHGGVSSEMYSPGTRVGGAVW